MTDSNETSPWMVRVDRRSGKDRRQFSYTAYIPERRSGKDRRIRKNRGRTYLLNIEYGGTMRAEEVRLKKRWCDTHSFKVRIAYIFPTIR